LPQKRTTVKKIREIIRLQEISGLSLRQISKAINISRPVVSEIISRFKDSGLDYTDIQDIRDSELEELLSNRKLSDSKAEILKEYFPIYAKELKKKGVTLQLLWKEYIQGYPDGLKYSQFCYHYQNWKRDEKLSLHIEHKAGDKMFVDYAGHKMEITRPMTGEKIKMEVFVAILPASQLTYAEASENQNQESFVRSTERAIRYFGGVPSVIVPDNLKSGVVKADIYEPDINPLFAEFAEYYRTAVMPARARKPKDKAHVENAVKLIYSRVFAPLRNQTFHTLEELNRAIREKLEEHNSRKLSQMTVSRRELFEEVEKSELKSLPVSLFPLKHTQPNSLAAFNYHVELKEDKHYYSVPYLLKGKRVKVVYDDRNVSIYHDNVRIVMHRRDRRPHKYTTLKDHMPPKHRFADNWNPEKLKWWAGNIGTDTLRAINHILDSKTYPEQAYKSCMGLLSLAKKYGKEILNLACRTACNKEWITLKSVSIEAQRIKEQYDRDREEKQMYLLPEIHENIRGKEYYT
jgi:transposase